MVGKRVNICYGGIPDKEATLPVGFGLSRTKQDIDACVRGSYTGAV